MAALGQLMHSWMHEQKYTARHDTAMWIMYYLLIHPGVPGLPCCQAHLLSTMRIVIQALSKGQCGSHNLIADVMEIEGLEDTVV